MIAASSKLLRTLVLMATGSALVTLAACGGEAPPGAAKTPDSTATADPRSVEEAQQRIAAAKAELAGMTAQESAAPAGGFAQPPPAAADAPRSAEPSPPPPTSPVAPSSRPARPTPAPGGDSTPSKATRNADDRCGSPCRAIASMRRAVNALCRMTGDDDARCVDAKRTLVESEGRISPCSC